MSLVNGLILAGTPCPYHADCKLKKETCPSDSSLRERDMSCGLARLNYMIEQNPNHSNLLRKVRDDLGKESA